MNASVEGSFIKRVPRKDGFFLFFVDCFAVGMAKECRLGGSNTDEKADERFTAGKQCGRRPLSTLGGKVATEEFEVEVWVVRAVSTVLVDSRGGRDRYSEGKESVFERCGTPAGNLDIGEGYGCGASTLIIL